MPGTLAFIQARMSSTRLPNKVLRPLGTRPALEWVVLRARQAATLDDVVVLTSEHPSDDALEAFCNERGFPCFRGDLDDVLDRYVTAARARQPKTVVRLTGDCPLIDPEVIDDVVRAYEAAPETVRYASNVAPPTFPDGLDCEVFDAEALYEAADKAILPSEREHVTPYIRQRFNKANHALSDQDHSDHRWTLDEPRDLEFLQAVFARLDDPLTARMSDVLDVLRNEPALRALNQDIGRNEGLKASLQADRAQLPTEESP